MDRYLNIYLETFSGLRLEYLSRQELVFPCAKYVSLYIFDSLTSRGRGRCQANKRPTDSATGLSWASFVLFIIWVLETPLSG